MSTVIQSIRCGVRFVLTRKAFFQTLLIGALVFFTIALVQNRAFIISILNSPLTHKLRLIASSTVSTLFIEPVQGILFIMTALCTGTLITTYYAAWKIRSQSKAAGTAGGIGALVALLGLGCAACGPTIIASIVALIGGHAIAGFLTKNTHLLFAISTAILLFAIALMFYQIGKNPTCNIEQ